jgi:hypothetical protein
MRTIDEKDTCVEEKSKIRWIGEELTKIGLEELSIKLEVRKKK